MNLSSNNTASGKTVYRSQPTDALRKRILDCLYSALDLEKAINQVLKMVGEHFNVDRAYIFENTNRDTCCSNTFEWCNKDIEPEIEKLQNLSYQYDLGGTWLENFNEDDIFFCPNIKDLPFPQYSILEPQNIKSMLQCAIRVRGQFKGYIGFDNCSEENKGWETDKDAIDTLLYISHLLTLFLLDYRREKERLEKKDISIQHVYTLYDNLLRNISAGIIVYNVLADGKFSVEYINDGLAKLFGCSIKKLEERAKKDHLLGIKKEHIRSVTEAFDKIQNGELISSVIFQIDSFDGRNPWILLKLSSSDTYCSGTRFYGTFLDISDEIATQEKLKQSIKITRQAQKENADNLIKTRDERNAYQLLLDQSSAMITVIDAETYQIVYANSAARKVTKDFEREYVGSVCYQSIAHSTRPCKNCVLQMESIPEATVREITYGNRIYRMVYKPIEWNGRKALLEYSEDITEQKQLLEISEKSVKLHESIIANIPTGIIVYKIENKEYKILRVNRTICEMLGIDEEAAKGANEERILSAVVPEDRESVKQAADKMITSDVGIHHEFRCNLKKAPRAAWFSANGRKVIQPDNSIYVYVAYQDITDRREKELEFQQRIDFIANLNDKKLIAKGRHNISKNELIHVEGQQNGAVIGKKKDTYDDLLSVLAGTAVCKEKQEELLRILSREYLIKSFAQGIREHSIDYRRKMTDGRVIWATIKCSLYEEPNTRDIIAFLYSYDNTDKILETQIINRISTIEYGLLALIEVKSKNYKVIYRLGTSREELAKIKGSYDVMIQQRFQSPSILGDRRELTQKTMIDTVITELKKQKIYTMDYSVSDIDGSLRRMRFHYSYLDETKEMVLLFSSNITESYLKEQEQIQKIEQSLKQAQESNRAKTEFFSRMSHDMRTPMNGIMGMTKLSEGETDIAVLKENIGKIHESGEYLLSLINDTLDMQRIESGHMQLEPQVVSTMETVSNIIDMVKIAAEAKGVSLTFNPGNVDLSYYVRIDPVRVKQIFVNLLSNAIKFTPRGGKVVLTSNLIRREGMISHDIFTVTDTGIGMSKDFLEHRIYQAFSQENNRVTANYAGSGLGLSIAKSLVEMMGGTISVESELGVGTTFTIHLDFERVDPNEVAKQKQAKQKSDKEAIDILLGKRILLAEDHPLNAEITKRILDKVGCEVVWKQDGKEALDCFAASETAFFDIILMDIRMPNMDGLDATRKIRALSRPDAKTVPIIAMTANAYDEDVKKSLEAGMNSHLGKPVEPEKIYETIAHILS